MSGKLSSSGGSHVAVAGVSLYTQLIFSFFLSIFMSCVVSAVSVVNTIELIDGFFSLWMTAWLKSWIVAFPTILVVAPLTRRLVGKLVRNTPS
jgi:hypothetical protein